MEFLNGANSIATVTQAPYKTNWENVAQGSYNLTAKATDNLGATTTSAVVPVAVTSNAPKMYDIHADHLNTPRVITDNTGTEIWRWDSAPFGETLPNEQPDANASKFTFNQRFPGQYFDVESNLHYNYFRDYDPQMGRYVQSDPIGLKGGINTFAYVDATPIKKVDSLGLQPAGAVEFMNFFKQYISPIHDRKGSSIPMNASVGIAGQVHGGMKGVIGEGGITFDNARNFFFYGKVCAVVGPGLYAGVGGTAGGGYGHVSGDPQQTYGISTAGALVPTGGIVIEGNSDGVSGAFSFKPSRGIGAMCGVMKCWYVYI